VTPFLLNQHGV